MLKNDMENKYSLEKNGSNSPRRELNMLERMAIGTIAEEAFKNKIEHPEGLEGKDLEYISNLGEVAEKYFCEQIKSLKNKQKFPQQNGKKSALFGRPTSMKRY